MQRHNRDISVGSSAGAWTLYKGPVSSARHIARSVRISRTTRSCTLHIQGYETYGMGTAVGDGRYETRYWLNRPNVS
jgi:hypothetical protein